MDNNMDKTRIQLLLELLNISDKQKITLLYFAAIICLVYTIKLFFSKSDNDNKLIISVYVEQHNSDKEEIKDLKKENIALYLENKALIHEKSPKLDTIIKTQEILLKKTKK